MSMLVRDSGFAWSRLTPVNDISFGYDFTYDLKAQQIYFLQHNTSSYAPDIQRVQFDGESRETFLSTADQDLFSSPVCLEFDAASRNLIVGNLIQSFIEVINVDNKNRATLYANSDNELGVGYPVRVTVNSIDSEVYWIDAGNGPVPKKLAAVRMDGTQARILVRVGV